MNERTLIEAAKKDKGALSALLSSHYNMVYGYMLKLSCNKEVAEDITQETMIKAIVHLDTFKYQSKFSTWLITIASNTFKNNIKKVKHTRDITQEELISSFNLEEEVIHHQQFIQVIKMLKPMKPKQKMPFILKHYYGYSYEEIAHIMKCPVGTVRSRIHNTIKKLQGGLHEMS